MMYIHISLVNILLHFDNYTPRSGRGVRFKPLYYVCLMFCYYGLFLLLPQYFVIMTSLSMRTVRYDIYYTVVCMLYVVWLVVISDMVIMIFTLLRYYLQ